MSGPSHSVTARLVAATIGCPAVLGGIVAEYTATPAEAEQDFEAYGAGDWARIRNPAAVAAAHGDLRLLAWARADPSLWDEEDLFDLGLHGNLGMARWAFASIFADDIPSAGRGADLPATRRRVLTAAVFGAAAGGHTTLLEWVRAADPKAMKGCEAGLCAVAAAAGHTAVLEWARAGGLRWNSLACDAAAMACRLPVLRWLRLHGCPWESSVYALAALAADAPWALHWTRESPRAKNWVPTVWLFPGGQHSLELGYSYSGVFDSVAPDSSAGPPCSRQSGRLGWLLRLCPEASHDERTALVQWIHGQKDAPALAGSHASALWIEAAAAGNLSLLRYARMAGLPWEPMAAAAAASRGHRCVLEWAYAGRLAWDSRVYVEAAGAGDLALLQWVGEGSTPWHADTCAAAAAVGALHVLQWAHTGPSGDAGWACRQNGEVALAAARGGHREVLQWAHANGFPWHYGVAGALAARGDLELLQWAFAAGCQPHPTWAHGVCCAAAARGDVQMLAWACAAGYHWTPAASERAAEGNHSEVLRWAQAHGFPWSARAAPRAASAGHLRLLQWLCTRRRKKNPRICKAAAAAGQLAVFQWACEAGYPWDGTLKGYPVRPGALRVLAWARANGYPRAGQEPAKASKSRRRGGAPTAAGTSEASEEDEG